MSQSSDALAALNAYRTSRLQGREVVQELLEFNRLWTAAEERFAQPRLEAERQKLRALYSDVLIEDERLLNAYYSALAAEYHETAPERAKPSELEKKYWPVMIDEHKFFHAKDHGASSVGWLPDTD